MARKRAENREGSLGFPGVVKPVFTKDSKPLGRRKRSLGHLGSVKPVLTPKEGEPPEGWTWVEDDAVETSGVDIDKFVWDKSGSSNFKGGYFIFVIFLSVCVEVFMAEDLAA
ncbi:hypothetical protein TNCV_241291 [Trichonephila clavipes]|nr:hypothetical protein TNCV_241291 [Trichonephila clavipes]